MPSRKFLLQSANSSFWLPHLGHIVLVNEIGFKGELNSKMVPYKNNLTLQNNAPILQNELLGSNLMVKFYVWSTCLICFLNLYHAHMKDYLFAFCQTLLLRSQCICVHSYLFPISLNNQGFPISSNLSYSSSSLYCWYLFPSKKCKTQFYGKVLYWYISLKQYGFFADSATSCWILGGATKSCVCFECF